jgi:hypothetical protein
MQQEVEGRHLRILGKVKIEINTLPFLHFSLLFIYSYINQDQFSVIG